MSVSTLQPVPVKLTEIPDLDLRAADIVRFSCPTTQLICYLSVPQRVSRSLERVHPGNMSSNGV